MPLGRRTRRRLVVLSALVVLSLLGWWWVDRQLEPHRLAATVLGQVGKSLQLELHFDGEPDYAFKPEPRLVVPNLTVRDPETRQAFLTASRVEVSLPWSSITGDTASITRIELDQPVVDLPGLRAWQARRPPKPFELPTLTRGMAVSDGLLRDTAYSISELDLELAHLQTGTPADVSAAGLFARGDANIRLKLQATIATPGLASRYALSGSGTLERQPEPLPFKLSARGDYRVADNGVSFVAEPLQIEGKSPLPNADGALRLSQGRQLEISFAGRLQDWPRDWPSLPLPLSEDTRQLPLRLHYRGADDLGDPLSLHVDKADTRLEATFRVAELQDWAARSDGAPLPPLNGHVTTPRIDLDGIEMEGVRIELRDEAPTP